MSLNAANDVNIRSTTYTTSNTDGQSDFSRTGIENTANIIVANNDGTLWIQSGGYDPYQYEELQDVVGYKP